MITDSLFNVPVFSNLVSRASDHSPFRLCLRSFLLQPALHLAVGVWSKLVKTLVS